MVKPFIPRRTSKKQILVQQETKQEEKVFKSTFNTKRHKFIKKKEKIKKVFFDIKQKFAQINLMPILYDQDEIGSYFHDQIEKINNLEVGRDWSVFYAKLRDQSNTLSLILLNQNHICDLLIDFMSSYVHLEERMLELMFSLLRDLKGEGYKLVTDKILPFLIQKLPKANFSLQEKILYVLSGIMKFQFQEISQNFEIFTELMQSLIFGQDFSNSMIKLFVELQCYVLKKIRKNSESKIQIILDSLEKYKANIKSDYYGSLMIFEMINCPLKSQNLKNFEYFLKLSSGSNFIQRCIQNALLGHFKISFKKKEKKENFLKEILDLIFQNLKQLNENFFVENLQNLLLFKQGLMIDDEIAQTVQNYFTKKILTAQDIYLLAHFLVKKKLPEQFLNILQISPENLIILVRELYLQENLLNLSIKFLTTKKTIKYEYQKFYFLNKKISQKILKSLLKKENLKNEKSILFLLKMYQGEKLDINQIDQKLIASLNSLTSLELLISSLNSHHHQKIDKIEPFQLFKKVKFSCKNFCEKTNKIDITLSLVAFKKFQLELQCSQKSHYDLNELLQYPMTNESADNLLQIIKYQPEFNQELLYNHLSNKLSSIRSKILKVCLLTNQDPLIDILIQLESLEGNVQNERQINFLLSKILDEITKLKEGQKQMIYQFFKGFMWRRYAKTKDNQIRILGYFLKEEKFLEDFLSQCFKIQENLLIVEGMSDFEIEKFLNLRENKLDNLSYQKYQLKILINQQNNIAHYSDKVYTIFEEYLLQNTQITNFICQRLCYTEVIKDHFLDFFIEFFCKIQNQKKFENSENFQKILEKILKFLNRENFQNALYFLNRKNKLNQLQLLRDIVKKDTLKDSLLKVKNLNQEDFWKIMKLMPKILVNVYLHKIGSKNKNFEKSKKLFILDYLMSLPETVIKETLHEFYEFFNLNQEIDLNPFIIENFTKNPKFLSKFLNFLKNLIKVFTNKISNSYSIFQFCLKIINLKLGELMESKVVGVLMELYSFFIDQDFQEITQQLQQSICFKKSKIRLASVWSELENYKVFILRDQNLQKLIIEEEYQNDFRRNILFNLIDFAPGNTPKLKKLTNEILQQYEIDQVSQTISSLGLKIIQMNLNQIINKLIQIEQKKSLSPKLLNFIVKTTQNITIDNQQLIEKILIIFEKYLKAQKINRFRENVSAQKYQFQEKYKDQIISMMRIISNLIRNYDKRLKFLNENILPFFLIQNDPLISMSLKVIIESISGHSQFYQFLNETVLISQKAELTFDYDIYYESLKQLTQENFRKLNHHEKQSLVLIVMKFMSIGDLSVRILSMDKLNFIFEELKNFPQKFQENFEILEKILKFLKLKIADPKMSTEGFKYYLNFFSNYLNFVEQNSNSFDKFVKFQYFDLQEINQSEFFQNISKIKFQTKIKALEKLLIILQDSKISRHSSVQLLQPLIMSALLQNMKILTKNKKLQNQISNVNNYLFSTAQVLNELTKQMKFREYTIFIHQLLDFIKYRDEYQSLSLKILQHIIGNISIVSVLKDNLNQSLNEEKMGELEKTQIEELKKIQKRLKSIGSKQDFELIKIAFAQIELGIIRHFPQKMMNVDFQKILMILTHLMKNKDMKIRQKVKVAFLKIAKDVGSGFLDRVVGEIVKYLQEGRHRHIRNDLLEFLGQRLLNKQLIDVEDSNLDKSLWMIAECAIEEQFSEMFEEKDLEDIKKKTKEMKQHKSKKLMKLVGKFCQLKSGIIMNILEKIEQELNRFKDLKQAIMRSNTVLDSLTIGISQNKQSNPQTILYLSYIIQQKYQKSLKYFEKSKKELQNEIQIEKKLTPMQQIKQRMEKQFKIQEGAAQGKSIFKLMSDKKHNKGNYVARCLVRFSLKMLSCFLLNDEINFENHQETQSHHNIFYQQLIQLLNCQYDELTFQSLKLIDALKQRKFNFDILNLDFFKNLMKILTRIGPSQINLISIIFKLLSRIFEKQIPRINFTEFDILFYNLEKYLDYSDDMLEPLAFLNTLIAVQMIKPQVYELVKKSLMIFLQSTFTPKVEQCHQILINFLRKFPFDKTFMQTFYMSLIKNLKSEVFNKKNQISQLLSQFHQVVKIEQFVENKNLIILEIITVLVGEKNEEIKRSIRSNIKEIMEQFNGGFETSEYSNLFKFSIKFLSSQKPKIAHSGILLMDSMLTHSPKQVMKQIAKQKIHELIEEQFMLRAQELDQLKDILASDKKMKSQFISKAWREFYQETENKSDFSLVKDNAKVVLDLLKLLWNLVGKGLEVEMAVDDITQVMNHPDSEVQGMILKNLKNLTERKELWDNTKSLQNIFVYLLNMIKKKYYDIQEDQLLELLIIFVVNTQEKHPQLPILTCQVLNQIAKMTTQKINQNSIIIERIINLLNSLKSQLGLNNHFIDTMVIFMENQEIMKILDFKEKLTEIFDELKFQETFKNLYFEKRKTFLSARMEKRAEDKRLAVTDPKAYHAKRIQKNKKSQKRKKMKKFQKKFQN